MKVIINETEFELRSFNPYYFSNPISLYIVHPSVDEIIEAIGDSASVSIPDVFTSEDLILDTIKRFQGDLGYVCEVIFKKESIEKIVEQNAKEIVEHNQDIESAAKAIEDLAELTGENCNSIEIQDGDIEAISLAIEELAELIGQILNPPSETTLNDEEEVEE